MGELKTIFNTTENAHADVCVLEHSDVAHFTCDRVS